MERRLEEAGGGRGCFEALAVTQAGHDGAFALRGSRGGTAGRACSEMDGGVSRKARRQGCLPGLGLSNC